MSGLNGDYHMLSTHQLNEMLNHAFQQGWWVRNDKKDFHKDSYSTIARDNYVFEIMEKLKDAKR